MSFIEFDNVSRRYQTGEIVIPAVDDVSFKIEKGEFVKIEEIEPIYLRLSQAEYQYMEKHKGDCCG